jgi:hypothetical protein
MKRTIFGIPVKVSSFIPLRSVAVGLICLFLGVVVTGCPNDDSNESSEPVPALTAVDANNWRDVDGLSGASVLRLPNRQTFVYASDADGNGSYTLKAVNAANPTVAVNTAEVGYDMAVMQVNNREGTIAVIAGNRDEADTEYVGVELQIYNSSLGRLKTLPFGDKTQATQGDLGADGYQFTTLYDETRGASLAIGDKYAAVIWRDDNDTWGNNNGTRQTYVGIYNIVTGASKHFPMLTPDGGTAPDNALVTSGIGSPSSLATRGDYIIVGGGSKSAAFSIASDLSLTMVGTAADGASHWMRDNGYYVMDAAMFKIKAWKWNGNSVPTCQVIEGLGVMDSGAANARAHVRIICFDQDDTKIAHIYAKYTPTGQTTASNLGGYRLNLDTGEKTYLFGPPTFTINNAPYAMSGFWGIDVFRDGDDYIYVLGGGTADNATVVAFKYPAEDGAASPTITPEWTLELGSSVHVVKVFKVGDRFFVVAKDDTEDSGDNSQLYLHEFK